MSSMGEKPGHEPTAVPLRGAIWFVTIFIASAVVVHLGLWWMSRALILREQRGDVQNSALLSERPAPAEPRLQPSLAHGALPRQDLASMRLHEDAELIRRGWTRDGN